MSLLASAHAVVVITVVPALGYLVVEGALASGCTERVRVLLVRAKQVLRVPALIFLVAACIVGLLHRDVALLALNLAGLIVLTWRWQRRPDATPGNEDPPVQR